MRPNFQKAQNTATELLLAQPLTDLHVDVRKFTLDKHIHITTMQNFCKMTDCPMSALPSHHCGALTLRQAGESIILYDDDILYLPRKHWGIAHEVGHVYMGHRDDDKISEIEAHYFAAQIVAPEIVLWNILETKGTLTSTDIAKVFNISPEAAKKRIGTMQRRMRYSNSYLDRELLRKYSPFLDALLFPPKAS